MLITLKKNALTGVNRYRTALASHVVPLVRRKPLQEVRTVGKFADGLGKEKRGLVRTSFYPGRPARDGTAMPYKTGL